MGTFLQVIGMILFIVALVIGGVALCRQARKSRKSGLPSQIHGVYPTKRRY